MRAPPPAEVSSLGGRRYADDAKLAIGLFARQLFATGTWVLEFSRWNDHLVDLRALKAKGREALDDRPPETALDDAQDIRFSRRCFHPRPIPNVNVGSIPVNHLCDTMPQIHRQNVGFGVRSLSSAIKDRV